MVNNGKIELLEDIIVDDSLLKHKKEEVSTGIDGSVSWGSPMSGNIISSRSSNELEYLEMIRSNNPSIRNKFMYWVYKNLILPTINPELKKYNEKKFTVENLQYFFNSIKQLF